MINDKILEQCRKSIKSEIGTLSDLPPELANTIANYYYKFYLFSLDMQKNPIPSMVSKEKDIFKGLKKFSLEAETRLAMMEILPSNINELRSIDKNRNPGKYYSFLFLLLDVYKYEIKNTSKKSGLRRMIERHFKKVNEIPNLVELLRF
jgi:hypothetical protein